MNIQGTAVSQTELGAGTVTGRSKMAKEQPNRMNRFYFNLQPNATA